MPSVRRRIVELSLGNGVNAVLGVAYVVILSRLLGPEKKGLFSLYLAWAILVATICNCGLPQAVPYWLRRSKNSGTEIRRLILSISSGGFTIAILFFGVAGLGWGPKVLGADAGALTHFTVLVLGIVSASTISNICLSPALIALHKVREHGFAVTTGALASFAVLIFGAQTQQDLISTALVAQAASLVITNSLFHWWYTQAIQLHSKEPPPQVSVKILTYGFKSHLGILGAYIAKRVDLFIAGYFLSDLELGWYSVAMSIREIVLLAPRAILAVVLGEMADRTRHSPAERTRFYRRSQLALSALSLILVVITVAAIGPVVLVVFGEPFAPGVNCMQIVAASAAPLSLASLQATWLLASNRPAMVTVVNIASAVLSTLIGILFVENWGIVGLSVSSVVSSSLSLLLSLMASRWAGEESA